MPLTFEQRLDERLKITGADLPESLTDFRQMLLDLETEISGLSIVDARKFLLQDKLLELAEDVGVELKDWS